MGNRQQEQLLNTLIGAVGSGLRQHITALFDFRVDHPDQQQIDELVASSTTLAGNLRELMKNSSQL